MRLTKVLIVAIGAFIFSSTSAGDVTIPVEVAGFPSAIGGIKETIQIEVIDLRHDLNLERTTIGGLSLGAIKLDPDVPEIVRRLIESSVVEVLAKAGSIDWPKLYCGIRQFDITTPATILYWDVNADIELIIRAKRQDKMIRGSGSERTYVWPSEAIIGRVVAAALKQANGEARRALEEILESGK